MSSSIVELPKELHIAFFPMLGYGNMIPILDIAKLFATQNVKTTTIITTICNAPTFIKPLETYSSVGPPIDIEIIPFPSSEGIENFEDATSPEMVANLWNATQMLEEVLENVLRKIKPNGLIADKLFPFASKVAAKFNIPRVIFQGTGFFSLSIIESLKKYEPHKDILIDDNVEFIVPNLPNEIKMTRLKLAEHVRASDDENSSEFAEFFKQSVQAEVDCVGIICDTFYELESNYADYCRNVLGKKIWSIGPVSLCNRGSMEKFHRGKYSTIDEHECLKWLDSKGEKTVIYISFGTLTIFSSTQLRELAAGLEASGQEFVWVVNKTSEEKWLQGFESRVEGKGLIIKGWAPQILILGHKSVGGFLTHCGWNSIVEAVSCGVPMVTWPVFADHFYNEKLVTDILKTGVPVGATKWSRLVDDSVKAENVATAVRRVMVGDEVLEIRQRAYEYKEMARNAFESGGSSYNELNDVIQLLRDYIP